MKININSSQLTMALERVEPGLKKYLEIMGYLRNGVSWWDDRNFRRKFNGFYKVRRSEEWQTHFYYLMGKAYNEKMNFSDVLREMYEKTGRIEASFVSKLCATVDTSSVVIDSWVLKNLGIKLPGYDQDNKIRINKVCAIHKDIQGLYDEFIKSNSGKNMILEFGKMFPGVDDVSDIKVLDLVLWQCR